MKEAETAFEKTTNIIFGKQLGALDKYAAWLQQNMPGGRFLKQPSGETIYLPDFSFFKFIPDEKAAGLDAVKENSEKKLSLEEEDLHTLGRRFGENRIVVEYKEGQNQNVVESNFYRSNTNSYRISFCFYTKNSAYSVWSSFSEFSFGCYRNMNSSFCINCYFSTELTNCFEMDACKKCSHAMFCHNCENVNDSLFCYNTQNLRYAVGNRVVGREKYLEIKQKLLEYMLARLEQTGALELSIYNLGCFKAR